MKHITINKPSQIKLGQRYRVRIDLLNRSGYSYYQFWIESRFYLSGYKINIKKLGSNFDGNILKLHLESAKKSVFDFLCKNPYNSKLNTIWKVGV